MGESAFHMDNSAMLESQRRSISVPILSTAKDALEVGVRFPKGGT